MKLIYLANARIPTEKAHGIQIMQMCKAFADVGAKIELVVPRRINPIKEDPFAYYNVNPTFIITRIPCLDLVFAQFPGGPFFFLLQTASFLFSAKIYLWFKKYDVLYTREPMAIFFFRSLVIELHLFPRRITAFRKNIWRRAKAFIATTRFTKEELIKAGVSAGKILVVPNGVDLKMFSIHRSQKEARQKLGLPENKKLIVYTGSFYLYDWKGIDVALEAAAHFSQDFLLVLVGGSDQEIAKIKRKYRLERVLLIGHKHQKEIPDYLMAADVLIVPNKSGNTESERYTAPLKLFEYMASGTPIIASDLPSIREIVNEKSAILVQPNDSIALAKGIHIALTDTVLADSIAAAAKKDVQSHTWDKRAEDILKFIER